MTPDELRSQAAADGEAAQSETATREQALWDVNLSAAQVQQMALGAKAQRDAAVANLLNCLAFLIIVGVLTGVIYALIQAF